MTLGPGTLKLATRVYFTGRILSLFTSFPFAVIAVSQGPPASPDGPGLEQYVQYAFLTVGLISTFVAWRFTLPGGALLILSGAVLGAYGAGRYTPPQSFILALPYIAPGICYLASWSLLRPRVFQIAWLAFICAVLWLGATEASGRHQAAFGAMHPSSPLTSQPVDRVEWAWSGGVTSASVTIKAKLAGGTSSARLVLSQYPDLSVPTISPPVASLEEAKRVVTLTANDLTADTRYYYGIEVDGRLDELAKGGFHTFPVGPASFTVAVSACARTGSNGAVFDAIRELDPLLYIIAGDLHYQNIIKNDRDAFRKAYDRAIGAPSQAALYRQTPIAYMWDDHDYGGNNSNANSQSKRAALAAYRENVPHYELLSDQGAVYQSFSIGRVAFIMTDLRSERDAEPGPDGKGKSLLGSYQRRWLKQELLRANSTHALVVWVSSVPWIAAAGTGDGWGAYPEEREDIAEFIAANEIRNLVMLAGDAHMVAIDDGTNSDYSASVPGGFPLLQAAALDRPGSVKGGPYSLGTFPGAGQYGLLQVTDQGESLTVKLAGKNWRGEELVSYTFSLPAPAW